MRTDCQNLAPLLKKKLTKILQSEIKPVFQTSPSSYSLGLTLPNIGLALKETSPQG